MSHFCISRDSDAMVDKVYITGSADGTAFIWGGASGSEYGQLLEIWSQQDEVRISANESSPRPNWIASYTIPSRYVGLTFEGVKRGTTIKETWNNIKVESAPMIAWGAKITNPQFKIKVITICERLRIDPNHLMACMYNESMLDPAKPNIKDGKVVAIGLIQFMESTAHLLGTSIAALGKMTEVQQLDFVEKFFAPHKGRLKNVADLYSAMFCVFAIGKGDEFVCYSKNGVTHGDKYYGPQYWEWNKWFDHNGDGDITKFEVGNEGRNALAKGQLKENLG
jgi:hypothetical protein